MRFTIEARHSRIPEVVAIHISMERLSGPPNAWRRAYSIHTEPIHFSPHTTRTWTITYVYQSRN